MDFGTIALPALIGLIAVALIFDFLNGLHDAANSIATIVSTRVLRPQYAVVWAAFFNFIAFLFFGLHVANTIGKDVIDPAIVDPTLILGALTGAIAWNVITWYFGIPSSSSHALIGGLAGAGQIDVGGNDDWLKRRAYESGGRLYFDADGSTAERDLFESVLRGLPRNSTVESCRVEGVPEGDLFFDRTIIEGDRKSVV